MSSIQESQTSCKDDIILHPIFVCAHVEMLQMRDCYTQYTVLESLETMKGRRLLCKYVLHIGVKTLGVSRATTRVHPSPKPYT